MKMLKDFLKSSRNYILLIAELYNLGLGVVGNSHNKGVGFKGVINFLFWFVLRRYSRK